MIAMGYMFNGIYYCVAPGIHLVGKTKYLPLLVVGASLSNVISNVLLIPEFGMIRAAWATTLSFAILAISTSLFSNAVYPIKYEHMRITKVLIAGLISYTLSLLVQSASLLPMAALYLTIILSFPLS